MTNTFQKFRIFEKTSFSKNLPVDLRDEIGNILLGKYDILDRNDYVFYFSIESIHDIHLHEISEIGEEQLSIPEFVEPYLQKLGRYKKEDKKYSEIDMLIILNILNGLHPWHYGTSLNDFIPLYLKLMKYAYELDNIEIIKKMDENDALEQELKILKLKSRNNPNLIDMYNEYSNIYNILYT